MSQARNNADLTMMTHMPLQAAWLTQLPAFASSDARLVRAAIQLLTTAFHRRPAGSLPIDTPTLALASGLSEEMVRENLKVLLAGWTVNRGMATFEPLAQLCARLHQNYGAALDRLQQSAMIAITAPDLFNSELLPAQGQALAELVAGQTLEKSNKTLARGKIKRELPDGAALNPDLRAFLSEQGFALARHDSIWGQFEDHCHSFGTVAVSWAARFRVWVRDKMQEGRLVPDAVTQANSSSPVTPRHPPATVGFSLRRPTAVPAGARGDAAAQASQERLDSVERSLGVTQAAHRFGVRAR